MTPRDVPPLSILKHSLAQMAAMAETPGPATYKQSKIHNIFKEVRPLLDNQKVSPYHCNNLTERQLSIENTLCLILHVRNAY